MKRINLTIITALSSVALFAAGLFIGDLLRDDDPDSATRELVPIETAIPADPDTDPGDVEIRLPRPSTRQVPARLLVEQGEEPAGSDPSGQGQPFLPPTRPAGVDADGIGTPDPDRPYVVEEWATEYTADDVFGPGEEPVVGEPGEGEEAGGETSPDPVFRDPCVDVSDAEAADAERHCPDGVGGTIVLIDEGTPPNPLSIMGQFYVSINAPVELRCPDLGVSPDGIYRPLFASNNPADFTIRYWISTKPETVWQVTYRSSDEEVDRWIERRLAGEDTWGNPHTGVHNCPEIPLPDDMPREAHFTFEIDGRDDMGTTASVRLYDTIPSPESQLGRPPMSFHARDEEKGIVSLPYDPDEEMAYLALIPKTGTRASDQTCTDLEPGVLRHGTPHDYRLRNVGTAVMARAPGSPAYDPRFSLAVTAQLFPEEGTTYLLCGWAATPARRSFDLPSVTYRESFLVRAPRRLRVRVAVSGGRADTALDARSVKLRPTNWFTSRAGHLPEEPLATGSFRFSEPLQMFDSGDEAVPTHTFIEVEGPRGAKQLLEVYTPTSCVSMLWVSVCPEVGVASYDVAIPDVPSGRRHCSGGLFGSCDEPTEGAYLGILRVLVEFYPGPAGAPTGEDDGWQVDRAGAFRGNAGERPATPQIDYDGAVLREFRRSPTDRPGLSARLEFDRPVRIIGMTPYSLSGYDCREHESYTTEEYRSVHSFRWDETCWGGYYSLSFVAVDEDGNELDWRAEIDGVPTPVRGFGGVQLARFPIHEFTAEVTIHRVGDNIRPNSLDLRIDGGSVTLFAPGQPIRCRREGQTVDAHSRLIRNVDGYPPAWSDVVRIRMEIMATGDGRQCGVEQTWWRVNLTHDITLEDLLSSPVHTFVYDEEDAHVVFTIRNVRPRPGAVFTPIEP